MNCLLHTLHNPKLSNPLPGLRVDETGELTLITPLFSCCQGEGIRYEKARDSYYRCQLSLRLQVLRKLLEQFKNTWGKELKGSCLKADSHHQDFQRWLQLYQAQTTNKGKAFSSASSEKKPSYALWLMAFMAVWKAGIDVHLVTLGKTKAENLLPPRNFATKSPGVIFIEQKAPLWRPHTAFDFDTIINWCEGAMQPIWIDFLQLAPASKAPSELNSVNLRVAFQQKISTIKQRPMLSWMGADCCSRLQAICTESEKFL